MRNVASCWLYSENILAMHGPMYVKSCFLKTVSIRWSAQSLHQFSWRKYIRYYRLQFFLLTGGILFPNSYYIYNYIQHSVGLDSSAGTATRYRVDITGIESQWGGIFHTCPHWPLYPPSLSFPGIKWLGLAVDYPPLSTTKVKVYSYTSTLLLVLHGLACAVLWRPVQV